MTYNKDKNSSIIAINVFIILFIIIMSYFCLYSQNVFAEEINDKQILDFNQIANYYVLNNDYYSFSSSALGGYSYKISLKNQSVWWARINITTSVLNSSHKYYISQNNDKNLSINYYKNSSSTPSLMGSLSDKSSVIISNAIDLGFSFDTSNAASFPINFNLMLIDLTQTFGIGNEPTTIEDFKKYFPNDFYGYSLSTMIAMNSADSFSNGYIQGINDTIASMDITVTKSSSYNTLSYITANEYPGTTMQKGFFDGQYVVNYNADTLAYLPFYIKGGSQLRFTNGIFGTTSNPSTNDLPLRFSIGYVIDGIVTFFSNTEYNSLSEIKNSIDLESQYLIPVDIDGIVFSCSENYYLGNISAQYKSWNLQSQIDEAYKSGVESVDTKKIEDTSYKEGYDKGKIDGIATKGESVWVNSMSFIKNLFVDIFDIFSIEILPNISIGTFIVIPLIFGVLFFIVKITKGD